MKQDIVQNIKDCGKALIDNAEKIAGNLPHYSRDLCINCDVSCIDGPVYLTVSYDFTPEDYIQRLGSGEEVSR